MNILYELLEKDSNSNVLKSSKGGLVVLGNTGVGKDPRIIYKIDSSENNSERLFMNIKQLSPHTFSSVEGLLCCAIPKYVLDNFEENCKKPLDILFDLTILNIRPSDLVVDEEILEKFTNTYLPAMCEYLNICRKNDYRHVVTLSSYDTNTKHGSIKDRIKEVSKEIVVDFA